MKRSILLGTLVLCNAVLFAQNFPGYISGNAAGVNGIITNPANIVGSRYRWDVNLLGIHAGLGNNTASFRLKNITSVFNERIDSLLFGNSPKNMSAQVNADILGPSVMFNINKKTSLALSTRLRALSNIKDVDGKLINSINDKLEGSFPFTISSNADQKIVVNTWADFGLTLARTLYDNGQHFLKGGITGKYLAGVGNTYIKIDRFTATVDDNGGLTDPYIRNASGAVAIGVSGADINDLNIGDMLKFKSSGFGADLGLVYEYRPNGDLATKMYPEKYKYKISLSLMDLGRVRYKPNPSTTGGYAISISGTQQWDPTDLEDSSVAGIKKYLDSSPYFTNDDTGTAAYKVSLPTNLQVGVDYNIFQNFFVALNGQINLAKKMNRYVSYYQNNVTLTPRYESKKIGVYLPINYNELTKFNAGLSLRLGPVFFGSGSVLTALLGKSKQADVHFGIRFGSLQKKAKETLATPVIPEIKAIDTDGDGINDDADNCKTVPGTAKYNGCPIPDTDGDGINDEADNCKTVPGTAKYNGCPIPDTDGDGINDDIDNCRTIAGTAKYNGCPIPDTDGDGFNDEEDRCPTVAGEKDNFGCPRIKSELIKKTATAAKGLQFATGSSMILKRSFTQLNNVVAILKNDPSLNLLIEGHTDNVGNEAKNLQLSKDRANAAKAFFVKNGIAESRISTEGYGPKAPIATNKTVAGRAQNRRVEFTLSN